MLLQPRLTLLFLSLCVFTTNASPYSVQDVTRNAFGHPFPSLTKEQSREFFVGNSFFRQNWVQAPSSTTARDGLGPTFNANSCSSCHQLDGRGIGAAHLGFAHVSLLFRLEGAPDYGGQLNPLAIPGVEAEAVPNVSMAIIAGQYEDGTTYELHQPIYEFSNWLLGTPLSSTRISPRVGPQLIGLGLLELIPETTILAGADPDDKNQDGISGRASTVWNIRHSRFELGRFGWKAEQPTIEQQSAGAFLGDMGLTTELFKDENCPAPQLNCIGSINGGSPEVDDHVLGRVTFYVQNLAVPERRNPGDTDVVRGEKIFIQVGCANCHQPSYIVASEQEIFPYTDLLLHDMGHDLADRDLAGNALATEWRTPPLWGIGLFHVVNGHTNLLHDGRARGVAEAILWHGGEGTASRDAFKKLTFIERQSLVKFVESL